MSKAFCLWVLSFLSSSNCTNGGNVERFRLVHLRFMELRQLRLKLSCTYRSANALSNFGNTLNIGMGGGPPYFYIVNGEIKGVDMQTVKLLSKKMGFQYNILHDPRVTGEQAIEMVRSITKEYLQVRK